MALRLAQLEREAEGLTVGGIIGHSPAIKAMARQIDRLAACDITVLVRGPSGSGKELVARAIHRASGRREAPFVALNCAAVPENLQESELFGHEKGSFTGAERRKIGRLEEADGGTLLLDEVAELDLGLQAKLLRALQERSFRRIGGSQEIHSDFRLLTATNSDLEAEVKAGKFREDLFFRIAVFELEVPPLGQRAGDIRLLAQHFLERYSDQHEGPPPTFAEDTVAVLETYSWPGNVRELENTVQHALVVCGGREIVPADLPPRMLRAVEASAESAAAESPVTSEETREVAEMARPAAADQPHPGLPVLMLGELERLAIEEAISKAKGNLSEACRLLGIGRTTLYRKLKQYEIQ
jgi:two-component system response regulator HydG